MLSATVMGTGRCSGTDDEQTVTYKNLIVDYSLWMEETLKELTIPEEEWLPASVFMPERYYVEVVGGG